MSVRLFFEILRAYWILILLVTAGTVAVAYFLAANTPKKYSTFTSVVVDFRDADPFTTSPVSRQQGSGYLSTQADIIRSRKVALKVLDSLDHDQLQTLADEFLSTYNAARFVSDGSRTRTRLADKLTENLTVNLPRDSSRVLTIRFSSSDPALAAAVVDGFANAFIDTSLELMTEPARRNAIWFDDQLKMLRASLEDKQRLLTQYQQEKGIIAIDERIDTETRRYEELSMNLVDAQAATFDVASRQLGPEHPEYKRFLDRERSVRQSLEQQKRRVFEVRQLRDELDLLVRDVENARKTYEIALQEYYQNSMASQFNRTNVAVLNEAAVPDQPSGPGFKLVVAVGILLGLLFGVGLSIVTELLSRRVRIEDDLSEGVGVPVLTTV